jgi:hypothetical protein
MKIGITKLKKYIYAIILSNSNKYFFVVYTQSLRRNISGVTGPIRLKVGRHIECHQGFHKNPKSHKTNHWFPRYCVPKIEKKIYSKIDFVQSDRPKPVTWHRNHFSRTSNLILTQNMAIFFIKKRIIVLNLVYTLYIFIKYENFCLKFFIIINDY